MSLGRHSLLPIITNLNCRNGSLLYPSNYETNVTLPSGWKLLNETFGLLGWKNIHFWPRQNFAHWNVLVCDVSGNVVTTRTARKPLSGVLLCPRLKQTGFSLSSPRPVTLRRAFCWCGPTRSAALRHVGHFHASLEWGRERFSVSQCVSAGVLYFCFYVRCPSGSRGSGTLKEDFALLLYCRCYLFF